MIAGGWRKILRFLIWVMWVKQLKDVPLVSSGGLIQLILMYLPRRSASAAAKCQSSDVLWGKGVLLPCFMDGMVGQREMVDPGSQMLPLMEKHLSLTQHFPSLCASRSIWATTNEILNQRPSCVKMKYFLLLWRGRRLWQFQQVCSASDPCWPFCWLHCCFWWQPWTYSAWKSLCGTYSPGALCKEISGKARKLQLHLPNLS